MSKPESKIQTIGEAIQQTKPFRNARQKAIVNIIYTYHRLNECIKAIVEPHGLTMQQYNVLRILNGADKPISTSTIRDRMLDKSSDTSRLVDRLCGKNYAARNQCPTDRRLVDVIITTEGKSIVILVGKQMNKLDSDLETLDTGEAEKLSSLLDSLRTGILK